VAVIFNFAASKFVNGNTVSGLKFVEQFNRVENYLNGGILAEEVNYELENKGVQRWVTTAHIYKPEFFGSPDPRMVAASGTVHHRFSPVGRVHRSVHHGLTHDGKVVYARHDMTSSVVSGDPDKDSHSKGQWMRQAFWPHDNDPNAGKWQTIRGMAITVFNDGGQLRSDGAGGQTRDIIVTASCSAWEQGSFDPITGTNVPEKYTKPLVHNEGADAYGPEKVECGRIGLFIDGVLEGTSVRRFFTSRQERWVVKNFMWTNVFRIDPGYHQIEFRMKVLRRFSFTTDPPDRWWRVQVDSRSMVVDMQNFRESDSDSSNYHE